MGDAAAKFFFEDAFGFPTGEAFVDEFDGESELLAETNGEAGSFVGHVAGCAVETKRKADDDLLDEMISGEFTEAAVAGAAAACSVDRYLGALTYPCTEFLSMWLITTSRGKG